jgi:hypothetical protein
MAETVEEKERRWIVRLARVLLESGKARGWSDAMEKAKKQVRGW